MLNPDAAAAALAEHLREVATRQGNIPFRSGDLRKSITVQDAGPGRAVVGSNLPYARPVHDGRPAVTIKPKGKKALSWPGAAHPVKKVEQPPRQGDPFLARAAERVAREGLPEGLRRRVGEDVAKRFEKVLRQQGLEVSRSDD